MSKTSNRELSKQSDIWLMFQNNQINWHTYTTIKESYNKVIKSLSIEDNKLILEFKDCKIAIFDNGQKCCEHRYIHTDDDLMYHENTRFLNIRITNKNKIKLYPYIYVNKHLTINTDIEAQFLTITTSNGSFEVVNYNYHNGAYGGFNLVAEYQ